MPLHTLKSLEVFRGCDIRSSGSIDFSPTGYYSLDLFQDAGKVEPIGVCARQPPLPALPRARPDRHVRAYTVYMHVDYRQGDHPVIFTIRSAGRELQPWQAYASYLLTGGFVLYGLCGDGFAAEKAFGPPEARPMLIDMAMFDPEGAAAAGKTDLHLGYICVREPRQGR